MSTNTVYVEAGAATRLGLSSDRCGIVKSYFPDGLIRILNSPELFLFDPIYVVYRGFSFCNMVFYSLILHFVFMIQQILLLTKHYVFVSFQAMLDINRFSLRPSGLLSIGRFNNEWLKSLKGSFLSCDGVVGSKSLMSATNNSSNGRSDFMSNMNSRSVSPDPGDENKRKQRNSDQEEFISHKKPKKDGPEKFTAFKSRTRNSSHDPNDVVQNDEEFVATIHNLEVTVTGSQVIEFARAHERKIQEYTNKPYYKLLTNGVMSKKRRTFRKYVLGAAICKHYNLDVRRFIEAQYHYHDDWRCEAPSISYVVSLDSTWNSVGRYKSYCEKFKDDLNYFDDGVDNVEQAYRPKTVEVKIESPNPQMVQIYEDMISHQMQTTGLSRKQILWVLGHPETGYIPWQYLKSLPLYQELVEEQAWGMEEKRMGFYRKIKSYRE